MLRILCATAVVALILTSSGGAAENNTSAGAAARNATDLYKPGHWRAAKLSGVNVYNNNGDKLGDISDVILDQSGKAAAVVIGVGGFLGLGEHYVAVNYDQLKWSNEPVRTSNTANDAPNRETTTGTSRDNRKESDNRTTGNWYPDHAILNANKDQLKSMPEFKY
ncbi:PRC-barrel domain-containing protein (plasmid) [Bradyrhizobium sp. PMVTL-01]|uniref:PRC-barrel domain-containing protein n=1 Tax=Bradyrhizobium sp. PMVTL-01 TaxID=3434999 RepID=UPI003F71C81D